MESAEQVKPLEVLRSMDKFIEEKYSTPDTQIGQQEARQDALLYLAAELGSLAVTPPHPTEPHEIDLAYESIRTINQATRDIVSRKDWSKLRSYLQDIAKMSKTGAGENQVPREQAFLNIAELI